MRSSTSSTPSPLEQRRREPTSASPASGARRRIHVRRGPDARPREYLDQVLEILGSCRTERDRSRPSRARIRGSSRAWSGVITARLRDTRAATCPTCSSGSTGASAGNRDAQPRPDRRRRRGLPARPPSPRRCTTGPSLSRRSARTAAAPACRSTWPTPGCCRTRRTATLAGRGATGDPPGSRTPAARPGRHPALHRARHVRRRRDPVHGPAADIYRDQRLQDRGQHAGIGPGAAAGRGARHGTDIFHLSSPRRPGRLR